MLGFGNNTFDPDKDIPDLSDKVFIVTGASSGIGLGIAAHLLQHNCKALYLLGKKKQHIDDALEELSEYGDTTKVHAYQIELEDLKQTDKVAKQLASELDRLDALICNAGLGVGPYGLTKDDIDSHMQVNHFAQSHLAMTLLPLLQRTPNSRLIVQSSEFHRLHLIKNLEYKSVEEMNQDIGPQQLYARSKLAQILFIKALLKRKNQGAIGFEHTTNESGPWLIATHPGGVSTDQPKQAEQAYGTLGQIGVAAVRPFLKDPMSQGCRPALFAATSMDVVTDNLQGAYIVPDKRVIEPSNEANDQGLAENLWQLTVRILRDKLDDVGYRA